MAGSTNNSPWIPEREIRFAVVIYGGVSLAIYINGVVQEMLHMVRSTSPLIENFEGSERIYRKLACLVGDPHSTSAKAASTEPGNAGLRPRELTSSVDDLAQPRSRFIVDILSGTSAGGINAIFLAKALVNGVTLDSLADIWIRDADMQFLLNDRKKKYPPFLMEDPPQALLNSRWMYMKLLAALQQMSHSEGVGALVGDLDLYSTTTDLDGLPINIALTDKNVQELRYKNFFHFKRRGVPRDCSSSENTSTDTNHFTQEMDPFLAFAARCTSSFPFAFEPMLLSDILGILESPQFRKDYIAAEGEPGQKVPKFGRKFERINGATEWEQFCQMYPDQQAAEESWQRSFPSRSFADGGYLDNKPFSYAIDTIMRRHASVPVDRKLIYIEPEPESLSPTRKPPKIRMNGADRPNAIGNVLDALVTLPRYETIRQDLERVIEWNHNIARLRRVIDDADSSISSFRDDKSTSELLSSWRQAPSYRTYTRLRLSSCADQLTSRICTALRYEVQSAQAQAIRAIVGQWREVRFQSERQQQQFLFLFDFEYVGRMIRYLRMSLQAAGAKSSLLSVLSKITVEFQKENDAAPQLTLGSSSSAFQAWIRYLSYIVDPLFAASLDKSLGLTKLELSASDIGRDARVQRLFELSPKDDEGTRGRPVITLGSVKFSALVDLIGNELENFYFSEGNAANGSSGEKSRHLGPLDWRENTTTKISELIRVLDPLFAELDNLRADFKSLSSRDLFDMQDSLIFPLIFGTSLGEFETVDIFRISPEDSTILQGISTANECESQLKGAQFSAFGGFLDQSWRLHDMLRGRLDGAERLITAILPDADPETAQVRESLIKEAQEAIAADWERFWAT